MELPQPDVDLYIMGLRMKMNEYAEKLEFEKAAEIRDKIKILEKNFIVSSKSEINE